MESHIRHKAMMIYFLQLHSRLCSWDCLQTVLRYTWAGIMGLLVKDPRLPEINTLILFPCPGGLMERPDQKTCLT